MCINGRRYVCCGECYIDSDEYDEPTSKRHSCHSGLATPVQIVSTPPAPCNPITGLWASRSCVPAGWLGMLLIKAGDVETNPGLTTTHKQVCICDICHNQLQVRKQISIRCNRIDHRVHLRCAGIRLPNIQIPGPAINTKNRGSQHTPI